ncbi:MAG: hypothetical protein KFF73_15125 [Cyclobacteriaceae bacterium]|nr:hypothetical protein [Cyclobacteriaceae bacterium]
MPDYQVVDTTHLNVLDFGVCGYKNLKTPGFNEKVNWIAEREKDGHKRFMNIMEQIL